ncbi:MAG TPA: nucleotidyltransferase domain-containing protein, partial [Kofleriaceae bacterium]|nr:nucleotidyltransferase domain-containing protein [Kofleriaceae bacterium]
MSLRLGGLADLDPMAVPLPAGTEVTTRVDRVVGGELRPQGASGRVAAVDGERVEVQFLDGRRATYLRSEVTPRKLGVQRYAQRRAVAWDALRPCVVIDTLVGSRAWGVSDEGSDEDRRGVFVLPLPWTTGLA